MIKRGPQGETAYVNQWFTVRNREVASKHVWAGTTRIATSLVPGVKPVGSAGAPSAATVGVGSRLPPTAQQAPGILAGRGLAQRSAQAALHARNVEKNPHYAGGGGGGGSSPNVPQENFLYYYHPDHLGSSSYVTDSIGKVFEHLEYFPFGETWVEESSNTQRTPYLFTAKELDEETGLYYFGARYYDPRVSVWQSPDPILAKYLPESNSQVKWSSPQLDNQWTGTFTLPGRGGVFSSSNLGLYGYAQLNPLRYKDPDGKEVLDATEGRKNYGKGTEGKGHHWVPFKSVADMDVSPEARKVFGQAVSGQKLPNDVHNKGHDKYIDAVREALQDYAKRNDIDLSKMTKDQAEGFSEKYTNPQILA